MAEQIYAPGPMATPAAYQVPGSSEIVPVAVQALLDGTNASGPFVPTLIFRSQAGHVIARVPTETTVAAGGSAEVSWFPGVKSGPSSAGTVIRWAVLTGIPPNQVIGPDAVSGNPTDVDFTGGGIVEDGSGFFFFDTLNPTYLQASPVTQPGFFIVQGSWTHDDTPPSTISFDDIRGGLFYASPVGGGTSAVSGGATQSANEGTPSSSFALYGWGVTGLAPVDVASTNYGFQLELRNFNSGTGQLQVDEKQLAAVFIGAA